MARSKDIHVTDPQAYILRSTKQFTLFMAGAGSGKTHTMGLRAADYIVNYPNSIGFIGANTHEQLSKSTTKRIFEVWHATFGWINGLHYVVDRQPPKSFKEHAIKLKSYSNTITFNNGAVIFLSSLENYRAIDGIEIGWGMLDETKDTRREAIDEVIVWRLRQPGMWVDDKGILHGTSTKTSSMRGYNPLHIYTSPAKEEWLNAMFGLDKHFEDIESVIFKRDDFYKLNEGDNCVVISSSFHNSDNLPKGFIESRMAKYAGNKHLIDTYIYGSPVSKVGSEFYHQFDRRVHVVSGIEPLHGSVFHLSCDQNVHPYYTMLVMQIVNGEDGTYIVNVIREYCLENPRNNMESCCEAFINDYGDICDGVYYYGDRSGLIQGTIRKTTEHHYSVLEEVLSDYMYSSSNRLLRSNPPVVKRRDFINGILSETQDVRIRINDSCVQLIGDMNYLKESADGTKLKKKVKDKDTQITYEERGHTSDALDYFLCSAFRSMFNDYKLDIKHINENSSTV